MSDAPALAFNEEDGTAADPIAFRDAIMADPDKRAALQEADLVIANHDLLLRWPPDYPAFENVIADEVHELADVADEVYALEVRPDEVLEAMDDVFGRPDDGMGAALLSGRRRRGAQHAAAAAPETLQATA